MAKIVSGDPLMYLVALIFLIMLTILVASLLSPSSFVATHKKLAIIPIRGEIGNGIETTEDILSFLKDAENDPEVGAILLDISSPGGSAVDSH